MRLEPAKPPAAFGACPSPAQLAWHELERYVILHFALNTYTDAEWAFGDESPRLFDPRAFDADAVVRVLKESGFAGLLLVAKHHGGFCLWPSATTEFSVKAAPWRDGKGDMVREFADACRAHGVKLGIYCSPWDRNHATYGTPAYLNVYRTQLRELLTGYGDLFTVWFDGANGGDGFYGGAREARTIDRTTYYDWPTTWRMVRELQPNAVLFSDVGPDVRWVGNESGIAKDPHWATYTPIGGSKPEAPAPGDTQYERGETGDRDGKFWIPAECDVPLRPGWFWHAAHEGKAKTHAQLMELYFASVGRGACLDLGIVLDPEGRMPTGDVEVLRAFGETLRKTFAQDLARGALVTASNTRGEDAAFSAQHVVDGHAATYWATDNEVTTAELTLEFDAPVTFDVIRLREAVPLGQRVERFTLQVDDDGEWRTIHEGSTIGARRLVKLAEPTTARALRLRVDGALACPTLKECALFRMA